MAALYSRDCFISQVFAIQQLQLNGVQMMQHAKRASRASARALIRKGEPTSPCCVMLNGYVKRLYRSLSLARLDIEGIEFAAGTASKNARPTRKLSILLATS